MRSSVSFREGLSDEQAAMYLQQLKQELQLESIQRAVSLMRGICAKVPWHYAIDGQARVIAGTSPLFHLLLGNPGNGLVDGGLQHLDELADALFRERNRCNVRLFRTEIDALRAVIIVLRSIQKLFDHFGLQPFGYTLRRELELASEGEAVYSGS